MSQPQLFKIPLAPSDIVFTPDWAARDMVEFFRPSGSILEPCKGNGVFLKYLPRQAEWCEIQEGRDFFEWGDQVDWIITNPPYSIFKEFFFHALDVSHNIVFLIPLCLFFRNNRIVRYSWEKGWLKHIRIYGVGSKLGFPMSNPIGALHWERGHRGETTWSWRESVLGAPAGGRE